MGEDKPPTVVAAAASKDKNNNNNSNSKPRVPTGSRPSYISGGQMLESPPLTARLSRFVDNAYNFLGLYAVSLFSMDPYAAAQNSQFNTRGPGRTSNAARARWGPNTAGPGAGAGVGGGPRGGSGGGNSGRRLGTVDDVRGPECGSCG